MAVVYAILRGVEIKVNTDDLKTIDEAADLMAVYRTTVYRWLEEKRLSGIVIGGKTFIHKSEIERINKERNNGESQ